MGKCLADSLKALCSRSLQPFDPVHLLQVYSEVERRATLPPSGLPLPPINPNEVETLMKHIKPRKALCMAVIQTRYLKTFPQPPHTNFNAALTNYFFPQKRKDAVVIGISKSGKPQSEPSSSPIFLLSNSSKLSLRNKHILHVGNLKQSNAQCAT